MEKRLVYCSSCTSLLRSLNRIRSVYDHVLEQTFYAEFSVTVVLAAVPFAVVLINRVGFYSRIRVLLV